MIIQDRIINVADGEIGLFIKESTTFRRVKFVGGMRGLHFQHDVQINDVVLEDVEFEGQTDSAIWAGADQERYGWVFDNVRGKNTGRGLLKLFPNSITGKYISPIVRNMKAVNCAQQIEAAIVLSNVVGADVYGLTIKDCGNQNYAPNSGQHTNGLWLGNVRDSVIHNNKIDGVKTGDIDGVGIFLDFNQFGESSTGNIVKDNEVSGCNNNTIRDPFGFDNLDNWGGLNSCGIGLCCGVADNEVFDNTLYDNFIDICIGTSAGDNNIHDNITMSLHEFLDKRVIQ